MPLQHRSPSPVTSRLVERGVRAIALRGTTTDLSAQALADEIRGALAGRVPAVIVDVTDVGSVDSVLLSTLVGAHKGLATAGAGMAVVCGPAAMATLQMHGLDVHLQAAGTVPGALALLGEAGCP